MKKRLMLLRGLFGLTLLTGLLSACQEEKQLATPAIQFTPETISSQPFAVQVAYTRQHLSTLGKGLLQMSLNPAFRSLLYAEVEKQKWGEPSVLFSTLFREANQRNIPLHSTIAATVGEDALRSAYGAFNGIDKQVLYPQVYIPFYEERKAKGQVARIESDGKPLDAPVIVIYAGEEKETLPGYTLDAQGNLVQTGTEVDENFARQNEVWVLSLNELVIVPGPITNLVCEYVDSGGRPFRVKGCKDRPPIDPDDDPEPPGPIINPLPPWTPPPCEDGITKTPWDNDKGISVYLDHMAVFAKKESWINGASEITGLFFTFWGNETHPTTGSEDKLSFWSYGWDPNNSLPTVNYNMHIDLAEFKPKWIEDRNRYKLDKPIAYNWGGMILTVVLSRDSRKDHMGYVIFEKDAWPTGVKDTDLYYQYENIYYQRPIQFGRSDDNEYAVGCWNWHKDKPSGNSTQYACNYQMDNNDISFKIVTKTPQ